MRFLISARGIVRLADNQASACRLERPLFTDSRRFGYSISTLSHRSCALSAAWVAKQVYMILDEMILAGEIQETSKEVILRRVEELEKIEQQDNPPFAGIF